MIEPNAFILMLSNPNNVHSRYIIFLVKCNVGYNDYRERVTKKLSENTISQKDDKISSLEKKIDELLNHAVVAQSSQEASMLKHEETKQELKYINSNLSDLTSVLLNVAEESELAKMSTNKASVDRINIPNDSRDIEHMAIVKSNIPDSKYKYKMICGIYSYVKITIGSICGTRFKRLSKKNQDPWSIDVIGSEDNEYSFVKAFSNVSFLIL